jgi:hypothetical protein
MVQETDMTEGWMLFFLLVVLGLLVIFGVIDNAIGSRDDERRRHAPEPGENLHRR